MNLSLESLPYVLDGSEVDLAKSYVLCHLYWNVRYLPGDELKGYPHGRYAVTRTISMTVPALLTFLQCLACSPEGSYVQPGFGRGWEWRDSIESFPVWLELGAGL